MPDIIYPTLDFFLYDLRNGLNERKDKIDNNRRNFYNKFYQKGIEKFLKDKDIFFEEEYLELLTNSYYKFQGKRDSYSLDGYYYPVRLWDTYGLLIDCSVSDKIYPQSTECFKQLKAEIEQRLNGQTATIGQTWMMSGWLAQSKNKSCEDIKNIAKSCYEELMHDSKWEDDIQGQGEFLGATIFELWHYELLLKEEKEPKPQTLETVQSNQHVIIILFHDQAKYDKLKDYYSDWLRLFCYRNKILWAYAQSRVLKQQIDCYEVELIENNQLSAKQAQSYHKEFEELDRKLSQLEKSLQGYEEKLIKLDFQSSTIEINLSNYEKRRRKLEREPESKLEFLNKFADISKDKYLLLITKDSETLERGWRLHEASINAIRSRIELDRAKRDRNFQNVVGIVGVGLASASLVGSLNKLGEHQDDPARFLIEKYVPVPKFWLDPAVPLLYSISTFVITATLTWLVIELWPRSR